jgi:hypothetical protein
MHISEVGGQGDLQDTSTISRPDGLSVLTALLILLSSSLALSDSSSIVATSAYTKVVITTYEDAIVPPALFLITFPFNIK